MTTIFRQGQPVTWLYTAPRGWNETLRVKAEVVKFTPQRVTIKVFKPDGSYVVMRVPPGKLQVKPEIVPIHRRGSRTARLPLI